MSLFSDTTKELMKKMDLKNVHAVPRITKVVLAVGVGKQRDNKQFMEAVEMDLAAISGQKPQIKIARKSVAGFNVREGNVVGYKVTLRGKRAEDFVERFVHVTLPRVRDFRGLPLTSFDGQGNLSVGVVEQLSFPEVHPDKADFVFGVEATFVTNAPDNEGAKELFVALGFPFKSAEQMKEEEIQMETSATRAARAKQRLAIAKPVTEEA